MQAAVGLLIICIIAWYILAKKNPEKFAPLPSSTLWEETRPLMPGCRFRHRGRRCDHRPAARNDVEGVI